jgi:hypothetical protein
MSDIKPVKLTHRQHAFIAAYLGDARLNATEAARLAGYSPKTAYSIGHDLLKKPEIQQVITAWRDEVKTQGIASLAFRVQRLDDLERRYAELIAARATDLAGIPGGDTGLLVRVAKSLGQGEYHLEYQADTALTKEIRELHRQVAIELGEWSEKRVHTGGDGSAIKVETTCEQTVTALLASLSLPQLEALGAVLGDGDADGIDGGEE